MCQPLLMNENHRNSLLPQNPLQSEKNNIPLGNQIRHAPTLIEYCRGNPLWLP